MASILLDQVSITFPIYTTSSRSLRKRVMAATTGGRIGTDSRNHVSIQALDNVSLSFEHGDRVGLVGHNGAGKTTLLRVLAGIYEPAVGRVLVDGNVACLLDVGLGMDPESTGYENIILRGLYLGLSKSEIRAKRDEIAAFTELGAFLDMPMRTYSAGMQARLSFAISTCIEPEILLLDEGIGAGDKAFLERAWQRIEIFIGRARILVVATHSEELIRRICNKAVLMEHGQIIDSGSPERVFERYNETGSPRLRAKKA